jgi:transcriptional regulator with XRE-family HTH domain
MVHSLAELLRARREELGLSRRELAERIDTSHSAIARVEASRYRVTLDTLQRIADALEIDLTIRAQNQ